jgi:hypothetical protein
MSVNNRQLRRALLAHKTALASFADWKPLRDMKGGIALLFLLYYVTVRSLVPANQLCPAVILCLDGQAMLVISEIGPDRLRHDVDQGASEHKRHTRAELMTENDHDARISGYSLQQG